VLKLKLKTRLLKNAIGVASEKGIRVKSLKEGELLQLAVGSGSVRAKVTERVDKHCYNFLVEKGVCPVVGQSIPLSKMIDGAWTIIGKGELENPNSDDFPDTVADADNVGDISDNYTELLDSALKEYSTRQDLQDKLKLGAPKLVREGGTRLLWLNFGDTCKRLGRAHESLKDFFAEELQNKNLSVNGDDALVIKGRGRYNSNQIQTVLLKYINAYVRCPLCKSTNTILSKEKRVKYLQLQCKACGSESLL